MVRKRRLYLHGHTVWAHQELLEVPGDVVAYTGDHVMNLGSVMRAVASSLGVGRVSRRGRRRADAPSRHSPRTFEEHEIGLRTHRLVGRTSGNSRISSFLAFPARGESSWEPGMRGEEANHKPGVFHESPDCDLSCVTPGWLNLSQEKRRRAAAERPPLRALGPGRAPAGTLTRVARPPAPRPVRRT